MHLTVFHEISWQKYFTVYPHLKNIEGQQTFPRCYKKAGKESEKSRGAGVN